MLLIVTVVLLVFPNSSTAVKVKLPFSVNSWLVALIVPSLIDALTTIGSVVHSLSLYGAIVITGGGSLNVLKDTCPPYTVPLSLTA